MPVELRKRKAPAESAPAPVQAKKSRAAPKSKAPKTSVASTKESKAAPSKAAPAKSGSSKAPEVGQVLDLEGFGGEIETNDGDQTTLKKLVEESDSGVVLLSYPKASTPGCTTQVCLARDSFAELTKTGLSIYGISRDSPKSNTTFKTKQNLPYSLLCDKSGTLITAVGLKKAPAGTTRGVFVIDKAGKVLIAQPGSPKDTVEAVKKLVAEGKPEGGAA